MRGHGGLSEAERIELEGAWWSPLVGALFLVALIAATYFVIYGLIPELARRRRAAQSRKRRAITPDPAVTTSRSHAA